MNRVFISYSRRNKSFAERLARDLSDAGLDVWIDFRQIHGGEMWQNEIFRGIERSEMLIACLSPAAVNSEWVQREIQTAREQEKFIIPIMVVDAQREIRNTESLSWLSDLQFINFENRYEEAFPQLLSALPGKRRVGAFDTLDPDNVPNPFKGLEAFQQTDASFFFGREDLIRKALKAIDYNDGSRFLAVIGASGSGKSSLVRAGVIPKLRQGAIDHSDKWRMVIFTPGANPVEALATRLAPLLGENRDTDAIEAALNTSAESLNELTEEILEKAPREAQLLLMIDQFEEVFTRASDQEAETFISLLHDAVTIEGGRTQALITMRADFFDRLGRYPEVAELFEQENMVIVTEMSTANLLRTIEGPAQAVGLVYEDGLAARILEDVRRQPGSLPLLQYALKALYEKREGRMLTNAAYDEIGGVDKALARHAETIYASLTPTQQSIMQRILMRLVEITPDGEATRRRINREDLKFQGVSRDAVQSVIDIMVAPESRLLIASREITTKDADTAPVTRLEVSHEALIREWDRYQGWINENIEDLRYSTELLKAAGDWNDSSRDSAYLLRGNRLLRAEDWLENADANDLQREFIDASMREQSRREAEARAQAERELELQKTATARLRAFVGVLFVALVIAGGLTIFAFSERQRAEENAQVAAENAALAQENARQAEANAQRAEENAQAAEENAAQALSFALATNAERTLANDDGDLALALAVESVIAVENPPPESRLSLSNVAFAPGTRRRFTGLSSSVNAIAYAPNMQTIVSGEDTGRITVWNVNTGERINSFLDSTIRTGRSVNALEFLPEGRQLIAGMQNGVLLKWDIATGDIISRMSGHERVVNDISTNSDGTQIASASNDGSIIIWDVETGEELSRLTDTGDIVADLGVVFDPTDAQRLYSISRSDLFVWDLENGTLEERISTGIEALSIAISGTGEHLMIGGTDGNVQLWMIESDGEAVLEHEFPGHNEDAQIRAVALTPDDRLAASGSSDESIIVWDVETKEVVLSLNGHERDITSLIFSEDSRRMLSGSRDRTMRLWDITSAAIVRDYVGHSNSAIGVYLPNGRALLSGSFDTTLRLWDIASGRSFQELRGHEEAIQAIDVNPNGEQAISGSTDMIIRVWNLLSGESTSLEAHTGAVSAVKYVDEERFISVGRDGAVYLWNTSELVPVFDYANIAIQQAGTLPAQYALAVSEDGRYFITGGDDAVVTLWEVETGEIVQVFSSLNRPIRAVAMWFEGDNQLIAAGSSNGDIMLWRVGEDNPLQTFTGHSRAVQSVEFSPDGSNLLSSAFDSSIRVWDIASGLEVRVYEVDDPLVRIQNVTFSENGETVLSGLSNGTLRLWRLYPTVDALLSWTFMNRFVPELTCAQRTQFRVNPLCDASNPTIDRELPPLPELEPRPETLLALSEGVNAVVNVPGDTSLRLRSAPTLAANTAIIQLLPDGTTITLLDEPLIAEGFRWWQIRTAAGGVGWAVESLEDFEDSNGGEVQTIVPISAFE